MKKRPMFTGRGRTGVTIVFKDDKCQATDSTLAR